MPVFLPDQAAHPDQQGVCRSGALCSGAARTSASRLTEYSSSQGGRGADGGFPCRPRLRRDVMRAVKGRLATRSARARRRTQRGHKIDDLAQAPHSQGEPVRPSKLASPEGVGAADTLRVLTRLQHLAVRNADAPSRRPPGCGICTRACSECV